jgi:hypothetical protein
MLGHQLTMRHVFTFIILCLLLTACGRSDARIQKQVTGMWLVDIGNNVRSLNVIQPDGKFAAKVIGFTNGSVVTIEGTFLVKNGALVETVTKSSQQDEQVPFVVQGKISLTPHEMITRWDTKPVSVTVVARRAQKQ